MGVVVTLGTIGIGVRVFVVMFAGAVVALLVVLEEGLSGTSVTTTMGGTGVTSGSCVNTTFRSCSGLGAMPVATTAPATVNVR